MGLWGVLGRAVAVLAVSAVAVTGLQDPGFAAPTAAPKPPTPQPVPVVASAPLDLGAATDQAGASDAPTVVYAQPATLPTPAAFDPSTAVVTSRDLYTTTSTDAHGVRQTTSSVLPSNTQVDGKWVEAEGLLTADGDGLTAARNPMHPTFASAANRSDVFQTTWNGYTVSFQLVGAQAARAQHRAGAKQSIAVDALSYAEALPGVDLQYEVGPSTVKEAMLLSTAPARAPTYTWVVHAPGLTPSVDEFGQLVLKAPDGTVQFTMPVPMMWDSSAVAGEREAAQANIPFAISKSDKAGAFQLTLTPDFSWLTDPARVYPVTVDPSLTVNDDNIHSYKQDGLTGSTVQVGNSHQSSTCCNWRTVLHYPYESLNGQHIIAAGIGAYSLTGGTSTSQPGNVNYATAFSYSGMGTWLSSFAVSTSGTATDPGLSNTFAGWAAASSSSNFVMLSGNECGNCYTYKNFQTQATFSYVAFPSVAGVTAASPQNGQVAPDMPVVQGVGNDPNGTGLNYLYTFTSSDGGRGFTSLWENPGPYQVPSGALDPGKHYSYTVSVRDGYYGYTVGSVRSASNAAWKFVTNTPAPSPSQAGVSIQDGDVVSSLAPTITVPTTTDTDSAATVKLDIRISTGSDGKTGQVSTSGWLTPGAGATSVSWTPPAGLLQDGGSYTLSVLTDDGMDKSVDPSWVTHFRVNLRLGTSGPSPYDAAGPAMVNLANGNLALSFASPTVSTLGGPMGLSFAYNSLVPADQYRGLTGSYYDALDPTQTSTTTFDFSGRTPVLVRKDATPSLDGGTDAPPPGVPADYFMVKWTGFLKPLAAGTYRFGFTRDDGAKLLIGPKPGTSDPWTTAYNQWTTTSVTSDYTGSAQVTFDAQPRPVEIDYYNSTGTATVHLYAQHLAPDGVTWLDDGEVNSSWFTTSYQVLPYGWSASAPIVGGTSRYASATVSESAITLTDASGSVHTYMKSPTPSTGGYVPPAGETSTVALDGNGLVSVTDGDGTVTTFNAGGKVALVTTVADVTKPASPTPSYDPATGRLTSLADPVTASVTPSNPRAVSFEYSDGTTSTCPQAAGYMPGPAGMLCRITYPGHTVDSDTTRLYYNADGELVVIKDPGDATSTFAYDGNGRLTTLRGSLQNDWLTADNTRTASATNAVTFAYDTSGRVASVTLPAPDGVTSADQPQKTYGYDPAHGTTTVDVTGLDLSGLPAGSHAETVTYDSGFRQLTATSAMGVTATKVWSSKDELRSTTDSTGHQTVTVYDPSSGLPTDSYGPVQSSCFDNTATDAAYLTLNGTCATTTVPHTHTGYDEDLTGLNATTYPNLTLSGAPSALSLSPATTMPASGGSTRMTGLITFPSAGTYQLSATVTGGVRIWVGDVLELDAWGTHTAATVTGQSFSVDAAHLTQRFRIETQVPSGTGSLALNWAAATALPASALHPAYNLATSSTVDDSTSVAGAAAPQAVTTTRYGSSPWLGQVASTTVDPGTGHLALTSQATYETTGWLRLSSSTSPAGATTAGATTGYAYYPDADKSPAGQTCAATGTTIPLVYQAGMIATVTPPSGLATSSTIRDIFGRTIATRQGGTGDWACVSYDARGRVTSTTVPASATSAAYQVTTAYSADGLTTTVTDSALTGNTTTSGVTTMVTDLLGRVVSSTDLWGTVTTMVYDLAGRATSSTTHLAADAAGVNHTTSFTYDPDGKVLSETVDGTVLATPSYDSATKLLQSVAYGNDTSLASVGYDARSGAIDSIGWSFASGAAITDTVTRSQSGRIVQDALTDGTTTGTSTYRFDAAGRLTQAVIPGHTLAYDYASTGCAANPNAGKDGLRVGSTDTMGSTVVTQTGYCYDMAGQLTSTTATAAPTGANPVLATSLSALAPTPSLVYDARGNLITFADESLTYDGANQHTGTTLADGTTIAYLRDAGGRIVQSTTTPAGGGTPVIVRYVGSWGTLTATGALDKRTVTLPGGVMVTIPAAGLGSATWAYPNLHGDYIITADHAGTRAATCSAYDPFGQAIDPATGLIGTTTADDAIPTTLTGTEDYGWAGGAGKLTEHAGDLATIEMGARQYIPTLGLFLSPDPVAGGNTSWYNYPDDPINANDYSGQILCNGRAMIDGLACGTRALSILQLATAVHSPVERTVARIASRHHTDSSPARTPHFWGPMIELAVAVVFGVQAVDSIAAGIAALPTGAATFGVGTAAGVGIIATGVVDAGLAVGFAWDGFARLAGAPAPFPAVEGFLSSIFGWG